jgi:hypothetical protein
LPTIKRKRVEITVFEQERVIYRLWSIRCPVCQLESEMLTPEQAGEFAHVQVGVIREWLIDGKAHGLTTVGGQQLVCRNSLFQNGGT